MSICFQSFNYWPRVNCCLGRDTSKQQNNNAVLKLSESLIPHAEESRSPRISISSKPSRDRNFSNPMMDQPNGVGIIGGFLVDSTLNFAEILVNLKMEDQESGLPFVLCSDPLVNNKLLSIDERSIVENLRCKRVFLEHSGVCCIVMPCHLSHCWYDEIKEGCSVPVLHMGECVVKELKEEKLRPIEAGSGVRIGVLSTYVALVERMYREKLENEGFEVVMLDKATMEHTIIPALEALSRNDLEGAQNLFRIALQVLLVRAVNKIIVASDELRELLPPDDPLWRKCTNPMDALARASVEYARSTGRGK
ncbi:Aspartate racemase [Handroanthus impetiginosus]|uniref:Aspartate racemase n=1 Tax=Handroanthus impetiginosus TaxID=429701 RepID=A0A2G9GY01_9LAMI|nr:Aspartate racemase [Handroanthus impetiginosus]